MSTRQEIFGDIGSYLNKYKPQIIDVHPIYFGKSEVMEIRYKMIWDDTYSKLAYQIVSVGETSKDTIPREIHLRSVANLNDFDI
jgi:hypothetical protein